MYVCICMYVCMYMSVLYAYCVYISNCIRVLESKFSYKIQNELTCFYAHDHDFFSTAHFLCSHYSYASCETELSLLMHPSPFKWGA